jgi:hypothetical protein
MKKIIYAYLLITLFHSFTYAQNSVKFKAITPQKPIVFSFAKIKKTNTSFSAYKFVFLSEEENKLNTFISKLPVIKLTETGKKIKSPLFTEFSFFDILETIFVNSYSSLINTYDEDFPELFKDAPFAFKLKCIISL